MDNATLTLLVAIIGCIVGLAGWYRNSKEDSEEQATRSAEIATKLDFLANDTKDVKAELRAQRSDNMETKQIALNAKASAEAAHDRLDAIESRITGDKEGQRR